MRNCWNRLFLEERPSIGLAFFRIFVAVTVGFHALPLFFRLDENYLHTSFKTLNYNFFTPEVITLVQKSPDWLVWVFAGLFCLSWFCFLIGLASQLSCVLMTATCYYFYALNSFYVGTLSWDILLVTLFLMCSTPYHGDYFSMDCLRRGDVFAYRRQRPFFIQRLLQLQIGFTYFYTALYKISAEGNWISGNPIYYLMHYPPAGVTKYFLLRDFLAQQPQLCYGLGIVILACEIFFVFLLFYPPTRITAIYLGFIFHVTLILTLDVPAIFFFLFPPQLLLFIDPKGVIAWVEKKRLYNQPTQRSRIIYDGHCGFCRQSLNQLKIMDIFDIFQPVDFHRLNDPTLLHAQLTKKTAASQLHLVEPDGKLFGGFEAFRRMCFSLPMCYPLIPVMYFPGMGVIGPWAYRWVAQNRYLFHANTTCRNNACFR